MDLLTEIVGMKKRECAAVSEQFSSGCPPQRNFFMPCHCLDVSGFSPLNNIYISFYSPSCFIVRMVAWYSFQMIHSTSPKFWLSTLALVWP